MQKHFVIIMALLLVILFLPLWAIETGEIKGKIRDEQGEGILGVEITAVSPNMQGKRVLFSSHNGDFHFSLLPVGTYELHFQLGDYPPLAQKNVIVRLGRVTNLQIRMPLTSTAAEVTVTAVAPLVDKSSIDTNYYLSGSDLEKIPVRNRNLVDVVKYAPGVSGVRVNTRRGTSTQGQPSFRGEGEEGNTWIVDGLCISGVRLKNSGLRLNLDSIDEVQIISDPFSPEYGSAYGGIINMVTKSGSNDFSGEFSLAFTDKNLQAGHEEQLANAGAPDYFSDQDWYINLGGPLIKDRLWFFISNNLFSNTLETRDARFNYLSVPGGEESLRSNNLFTKLSYALNNSHNLSLTTIFQKSLSQKGGIGIPELYDKKDFTDLAWRVNYKGILSPSAFIETGLGYIKRDQLDEPVDQDLGPAMYYIEDLARNVNNSYGSVTDDQKRFDLSFKLTKYFDSTNFGRHEINLGFEYYAISSQFKVDFSGKDEDLYPGNGFDSGTKYYFDSWDSGRRTPTFFYEYGEFDFINSSRGTGIYFKDKVTINRFTFMLGLRSQTQLTRDNQGKKMFSWGFSDFLSPRLSLAVDLTGDGNNIIKLGWGRFSDLITTMPLGLLNSGAGLTFRTHRWQGPDNPEPAQLHNTANWVFENEQKTQPFEIAPRLKPNFLSRILIEYDRRLGKNWAASIRYVTTRAKNLLEVLAVFDFESGYKFLYDNFEYKRRDYRGLEFELNGKIGANFFLNASYSLSSAKGTNPGQTETGSWSQEEGSTNYLGLFGNHIFIPNIAGLEEIKAYYDTALAGLGGRGIGDEGWYGKLPYSIDHNIKLLTVFAAPYGFTVSTAFEWISGYFWEKLGYVPYFGGYYSYPESRGTRKTPGHFYLDLGIEKGFQVPLPGTSRALQFTLRFDAFNLLNSQKPVSFVKEDIPIFGEIWGRQQPRQARVSLILKW